jgi:3D (Asp-Asp-Asp) domain-containing protein
MFNSTCRYADARAREPGNFRVARAWFLVLPAVVFFLTVAMTGSGTRSGDKENERFNRLNQGPGREYVLEITGYCKCAQCCGWKRNWYGRPVVREGPNAGEPKQVGITASGARARRGTIAADTAVFPFGTRIFIPGYGYGRVEDRGRDIKRYHIDVYFETHAEAQEWGRVRKVVTVWKPAVRAGYRTSTRSGSPKPPAPSR